MVATSGGTAGELGERLEARRDEIEQTLLTRVYAVSDPAEVGDPEYALGLRTAVTAALRYALECLDTTEAQRPPLPPELPAQARAAARAGVSLDTVLRRYFAGYTLLTDCLVRAAQQGQGHAHLAETMRSQAELFDRLVAAVTEAYVEESERRCISTEQRRTEKVRRMLRGELLDASDLGYSLEGWHVGLVGAGLGASAGIRGIAQALGCRLLLVQPSGDVVWAWLGTSRPLKSEHIQDSRLPAGVALAIGEPARGSLGWRSSHRQAIAALPVAQRTGQCTVRYGDVALLAASLSDEVLAGALRELYLEPLLGEPDGGEALRRTARAYLEAGRNVSATAAALRVSRPTVKRRLRIIEERIGRPPEQCGAEMETALALHELDPTAGGRPAI